MKVVMYAAWCETGKPLSQYEHRIFAAIISLGMLMQYCTVTCHPTANPTAGLTHRSAKWMYPPEMGAYTAISPRHMSVPYAIALYQHCSLWRGGLTARSDEGEEGANRSAVRDDTPTVEEQPRSDRPRQRNHLHVPLLHLALHAVVQLRVHVDLDILLGVIVVGAGLRVPQRRDGVHVRAALVVNDILVGLVHAACGVWVSDGSMRGPMPPHQTLYLVPR